MAKSIKAHVTKWVKQHPIGTVVAMKVNPYLIEEADHGCPRKANKDPFEAAMIKTKPFKFANGWCVKLHGIDRPVYLSKLQKI